MNGHLYLTKYILISIFIAKNPFSNLGLIRMKGDFSAEKCSEVISIKLHEFRVDVESDIVVITTDGCAMMKKLGRILPPFQ